MRPSYLFILVGLVLGPPTLHAQPRTARGTHELSIHATLDFESAIGDMIQAEAGYAFFVRDRLSLRATLGYAVLEDVAGDDADYRMQSFGVGAEYHFAHGRTIVPYLGLGIGWHRSNFGERVESAATYGPDLGIKLFLADNVALDFNVTYRLSSGDVFINDFVPEDSDLRTGIGLRVSL